MESLGQYLRREREFRKVSLEEVAKKTRISLLALQTLESDRPDDLPSPVFVKGFLKSYSQFVGLDLDEVLLRYDDLLQQKVPDEMNQEKIRRFSSIKPKGRLFGLILFLMTLLLAFVWFSAA